MSIPLATIFHGDVTLEEGSEVTQFGYGDLTVNRKIIVNGNEDSTGAPSIGSVLINGGVKINKSLHVHKDLFVLYGITNLTETHIDTSNGPTTITGGNKVDISVGAASQFVTTMGNLSLISQNNSLKLLGGLNSITAVDINATHSNGGVTVMSGTDGGIDIGAGMNGITETTSNGNLVLTSNNGYGSFIVNTLYDNQDLTLKLTGNTDSQIKIESGGNNTSKDAILLNTSNNNGDITISNKNGLGDGKLNQFVGSGGFNLVTNTSGPISILGQAASASFLVKTSTANQNMTIGLENCNDVSLILKSSGTDILNKAIVMETTCPNGSILITNPQSGSTGKIELFAGSRGLQTTSSLGSTIVNTYGASSSIINHTTSDNQDLNISITGETNSKINITSSGTGNDAILLQTSSGGIKIDSEEIINIQAKDTINIGTGITVPVNIGTATSVTTINGDLMVKGTTTTINTNVVTVEDNIMLINSAPLQGSDGGIAIKRYQDANNNGTGDVVSDTPEESGVVQNGDNSLTTIHLGINSNVNNDYYNGWWIKIYDGTGALQVRKIKSYDGNTQIATIYTTDDQINILDNPIPIEGMDFSTVPDVTSQYHLYPCHYVLSFWDESNNEFALVCSSGSPSEQVNIAHYADLRLGNLKANNIITNTINGSMADITTTVTLNDQTTSPIMINAFPRNYGIYMVFVKPTTKTHRAHAIFMIGRVDYASMPGTVVRIISVKGTNSDQLDIQWVADSKPELFYRRDPNVAGENTQFTIKIVSL